MSTPVAIITMFMRETNRLKTVQAVLDRMARVGQAAEQLGLSRRQLERLLQRYKQDGVQGWSRANEAAPATNNWPLEPRSAPWA
jgi:hypothetical protein